ILKLYERKLAMKAFVTHKKTVIAPGISHDAYYPMYRRGSPPQPPISSRPKRLLEKMADPPFSAIPNENPPRRLRARRAKKRGGRTTPPPGSGIFLPFIVRDIFS